jgi:hypothetical protein
MHICEVHLCSQWCSRRMNEFRNSGLWPVDRNVLTNADCAPSMVAYIEHVPNRAIPKETPGNNGYIPAEKTSQLPSNSAERTSLKSRKKH